MGRKKNEDLFFGLRNTMTDEQREFESYIMNNKDLLVICDSLAGTGKTTIAIACAKMLVSSKKYDGLYYIFSPVEERTLGYSTGDIQEKEAKYLQPLKDGLMQIREDLTKVIFNPTITDKAKLESVWAYPMSHTFLRGSNIQNKVVIIDEAQNYTLPELRKVLTRIHDSCKVILIGSTVQSDIKHSGFRDYIEHFKGFDKAKFIRLTKNFRGELSSYADSINL